MKMKTKIVALIQTVSMVLAVLGQPASQVQAAGVWYAAADGINEGSCPITAPCNIQRAVSQAASGDTIYLESGTYTASNDADPRVIWITKNLTLTGSCDFSSGSAVCSQDNDPSIINGEGERRVIHVQIASDLGEVELNFLHIIGGNGNGAAGCTSSGPYTTTGCGGGILWIDGTGANILRVNSCKFWANFGSYQNAPAAEAGFGGGIYFSSLGGTLEVSKTFFQQNAAARYGLGGGGAIYVSRTDLVSIDTNGFSENYCSSNSADGMGCAIHAVENAEVEIHRNLFNLNNKTIYLVNGGAITLRINDHFSVQGNILTENTGARVISGSSNIAHDAGLPDSFSQNWFWNNNATDAIYYYGENAVNIINNFIGHLSTAPSHILSGIKVEARQSDTYTHVNILHNSIAYLDHGISLGSYLEVELKNNIIAYNRVDAVDIFGSLVDFNPDTNMIYANPAGDLSGPNLITANPRFKDGTNGNFHLLPGSPAINAGIPLGYVVDRDNEPRSLDFPDIGADEYVAYSYLPLIKR